MSQLGVIRSTSNSGSKLRMRMSRLIQSKSSLPQLHTMLVSGNGRMLAAGASYVGEAETVDVKSPSTEKLLVLGGNGFVGSHVCKEALTRGLNVSSISRSGRSSVSDSWAKNVTWHRGDLLSTDSLTHVLDGVTTVISCVGGFGSNSYMYRINGTANINVIRAAAEQGVQRFVYISAADFGLLKYLLKGYYEGKLATESELMKKFLYRGVILRPGFIYGTRQVGSVKLPLGVIGAPMEKVLKHAKPLTQLPLIGPLFITPVNVTSVAKVAVRAAICPVFPHGVIDAYDILQYSQN